MELHERTPHIWHHTESIYFLHYQNLSHPKPGIIHDETCKKAHLSFLTARSTSTRGSTTTNRRSDKLACYTRARFAISVPNPTQVPSWYGVTTPCTDWFGIPRLSVPLVCSLRSIPIWYEMPDMGQHAPVRWTLNWTIQWSMFKAYQGLCYPK